MSLANGAVEARGYAERIVNALEAVEEHVGDMLSQVEAQQSREQFSRRAFVGIADAAGQADLRLEVPLGEGVRLISAACSGAVPGALTGCAMYLGNPDNEASLIHVFDYGQRFSDVFAEGEYVDSGGVIVIRFVGQPAGQRVTANLKLMIQQPTDARVIH